MPNLGTIDIAQEKFEYAGVLLRLSLSSILIRHKNEAFRERFFFNLRNLKTLHFRFCVHRKRFVNEAFCVDNYMISLISLKNKSKMIDN